MVSKKLFGLKDLSKTQAFYIYKTIKVIIVYKNKNLIFSIFQIMMPHFESFDNS